VSAELLGRIAVVLVEPREPGNIGAAARALANAGLSRLVLVRPAPHLVPDAFRMALAARPILEAAPVHDDLGAALAGFTLVAGTTRRTGASRRERTGPRALAAELLAAAADGEVAVLFGREECGLTNAELQYCQRLVTIPSSDGFPSLNLAQAVMVVAYELFSAAAEGAGRARAGGRPRRATSAHLEELYAHMEAVLLDIGYLHGSNPRRMMGAFRRLFGRAGLDEREVKALRGVFRQVAWAARRGGGVPGP
jgi:tRNA/rRNA methyltransferase